MNARFDKLSDCRRIFRLPRPRWSIRTTVSTAVAIIAIVSVLTLVVLHRPLWIELETVTAILSVITFMFFGHVLYRGVRFSKHERFDFSLRTVGREKIWDAPDPLAGTGDLLNAFDIDAGLPNFILNIVISILLVFVLTWVLWLGLNIAINAATMIAIPLFYFFRFSLRQIVALGRTCHGKLGRSCRIAAGMTFAYMAWFYALIYAAHQLHFALHKS